jgi:hypothetical protein
LEEQLLLELGAVLDVSPEATAGVRGLRLLSGVRVMSVQRAMGQRRQGPTPRVIEQQLLFDSDPARAHAS